MVIANHVEGSFKNRRFASIAEIRAATIDAGLKHIRPGLMTIATTVFGLAHLLGHWPGLGRDAARE